MVAAEQTQEVRRSFGLRMVVAVLGLVATLLTSVVAVRTLDARSATGFLAVLGALMLGPMFGRLGLGQNAIRTIAAATTPAEVAAQVLAHLRAVALLSVVTAPVVAWVATVVVREDRALVIALVVAMIVLEALRLTISDVYAALGRITWSVAATHHSRSILALLAMGVVVLVQGGETTLVTLLTVYAATSLVLLAVTSLRLPLRDRERGARSWAPMLVAVAAGAWLATVELGAFLVGRGNVWIAGWTLPTDQALLFSPPACWPCRSPCSRGWPTSPSRRSPPGCGPPGSATGCSPCCRPAPRCPPRSPSCSRPAPGCSPPRC